MSTPYLRNDTICQQKNRGYGSAYAAVCVTCEMRGIWGESLGLDHPEVAEERR